MRICPITDPELFRRADLFIETLHREGVRVKASALRPTTSPLPDKDAYAGLPPWRATNRRRYRSCSKSS